MDMKAVEETNGHMYLGEVAIEAKKLDELYQVCKAHLKIKWGVCGLYIAAPLGAAVDLSKWPVGAAVDLSSEVFVNSI